MNKQITIANEFETIAINDLQRYGVAGWAWSVDGKQNRTNESGEGLWIEGQQIKGNTQFELNADRAKAVRQLRSFYKN